MRSARLGLAFTRFTYLTVDRLSANNKCNHRCRSRQIFGGAKDFCPNFLKLARKIIFLCMKTAFRMTSKKKRLRVILGAIFSNESTLGAISFKSHTLGAIFARNCREFAKVFTDFARIFRDFNRVSTKSKLLGVRLHHLHPRLLHHWV